MTKNELRQRLFNLGHYPAAPLIAQMQDPQMQLRTRAMLLADSKLLIPADLAAVTLLVSALVRDEAEDNEQ